MVRAIPAPGSADQPRSWFDKLNEWARENGAGGLGYLVIVGQSKPELAGKGLAAGHLTVNVRDAIANAT